MSFDVEEFVHYQLANAEVRSYPFPHFYVAPAFPPDFYALLQKSLPPTDWYRPIDDTDSVTWRDSAERDKSAYPERFITDLAEIEEREQREGTGELWRGVAEWLMADRFRSAVLAKFQPGIVGRFGAGSKLSTSIDARMVRDFTRYAIGPHTDSEAKLVSLLFYLPANDAISHLGTSIYAPRDPSFRCDGGAHYDFELFKKVATMPFAPNALFGFLKTDHSFHGVDQIVDREVERNLLLYNIYVRRVTRGAEPAKAPGRRWPWSSRGK